MHSPLPCIHSNARICPPAVTHGHSVAGSVPRANSSADRDVCWTQMSPAVDDGGLRRAPHDADDADHNYNHNHDDHDDDNHPHRHDYDGSDGQEHASRTRGHRSRRQVARDQSRSPTRRRDESSRSSRRHAARPERRRNHTPSPTRSRHRARRHSASLSPRPRQMSPTSHPHRSGRSHRQPPRSLSPLPSSSRRRTGAKANDSRSPSPAARSHHRPRWRAPSRSRSPSSRHRKKRPRSRSRSPASDSRDRRRRHHSPVSPSRRGPSASPHRRSRKPLPSQAESYAHNDPSADAPPPPPLQKEKPNFRPSGLLAAESNKVTLPSSRTGEPSTSIVLKYHEPAEARKPPQSADWKLFVFKGASDTPLDTIPLSARSCWLIGREAAVADIAVAHPSCSKQHAVLQFRHVVKRDEWGEQRGKVGLYVLDLDSANGTRLNGDRLDAARYVELRTGDVLALGDSEREYVVLLPPKE